AFLLSSASAAPQLQHVLKESHCLRTGEAAEAGIVHRIGDEEMPGTRDHHRADEETRLFESGEKRYGLRPRIDNVVMVAVDQQKPRQIPVDRGVTDRGSLEKDSAVVIRRCTKKFLRNIVAGPRQ